MKRNNALLARQETAKVGTKCLAVTCQFGIRCIAANVIDEVLRDLRLGTKGQAGGMRKVKLRVNESIADTLVL